MSENIVAALHDPALDKYTLLERVLETAGFFEVLEARRARSGKSAAEFNLAVKPNLTMMLRRGDVGTYTDPFLVIHLLRLLLLRGYRNLVVVESQNLYGNWFEHRSVIQIAAREGYLPETVLGQWNGEPRWKIRVRGGGVDAEVPLMDMTLDAGTYDLGPPAGAVLVGRPWAEADFRVSFAKMKTHFYSAYTLGIKNIYGCLPIQDKVRAYHCRRVVATWTAQVIKAFPVDFAIVDGCTAADGWLGVKMKAIAVKAHTMLAAADLVALDHFGAGLVGEKPERSVLFRELTKLVPLRSYRAVGNAIPIPGWRRAPIPLEWFSRLVESNAWIMDLAGSLSTGGFDPCFPHRRPNRRLDKKLLYYLTVPVNLALDAGYLKLRLRERAFLRRLRGQRERAPLVAGSDYIMARLCFLSREDVERLIDLLDQGPAGSVEFSGHYVFSAGRETAFPARLSPSNIAAVEIVNHAAEQDAAAQLSAELRALLAVSPDLFGSGYPVCYR